MSNLLIKNNKNKNKFDINKLIELTRKKDKILKKYIDYYLNPKTSKLNIDEINKNIDELKKLNENQLLLIQSTSKKIKDANDPSKYFPGLIAIIGLILSLYTLLGEEYEIILFIVTFVLTMLAIGKFFKMAKIRTTMVFFNTLIDNMKTKNK